MTRLEPPYVVAMLCITAVIIVAAGMSAGVALKHLGAGLLYQHNLIYGNINPLEWRRMVLGS